MTESHKAESSRLYFPLGVIALAIILWWAATRSFETAPPLAASHPAAVATLAVARASAPAAAVALPEPEFPAIDEQSLALLHVKLSRWMTSLTDDGPDQPQLLAELVGSLTDDNVAAITRSLSAAELKSEFGMAALARWLAVDRMQAARWMSTCSETTEAQGWLVARRLLENTSDLKKYCAELPQSAWKQNVLIGACLKILSRDPIGALNLAQQLDAGVARDNLLRSVAYDWTAADPAASMKWIAGVSDPLLRDQLLAATANAIAASDPDLAGDLLIATINSKEVFSSAFPNIVETWASRDAAAVAAWVRTVPDGPVRDTILEIVARNWLRSNPDAATGWLRSLPQGSRLLAEFSAN
jgi:hypothetical protein